MQVLRDEEINGIEVDLGSCDDVEHWLSSVSVGSKNMAPTEAVKDLDKPLGSTDDSIADLALDHREDDSFSLWNRCEDCR